MERNKRRSERLDYVLEEEEVTAPKSKVTDWLSLSIAAVLIIASMAGIYFTGETRNAVMADRVDRLMLTDTRDRERLSVAEANISNLSSEQKYLTKNQVGLEESIKGLTAAVHKMNSYLIQYGGDRKRE